MLRQAVEVCPSHLWEVDQHSRVFWKIAYHTLFYTHLYLMPTEADFVRWERHRKEWIGIVDSPDQRVDACPKEVVLAYCAYVDSIVDEAVDKADLDSPACGFYWYDLPKLDHQIMNIRHVQQHSGQLSELLMAVGVDTDWVG